MEIFKDLSNPASQEFEKLLSSQLSKVQIEEGKIIEGKINKITEKYVFLFCEGLKSEPVLDINELKGMGLSDKVGTIASMISKKKSIRKLVHYFQLDFAYNPPNRYKGSCLDGRDITYNIVPDADVKFYITANIKTRALRRYKELRTINKKTNYNEVLKSIKKRDKSDKNRKIAPLKKTKDSLLINTTNLTKRACFLKIKKIIDEKLRINGNL